MKFDCQHHLQQVVSLARLNWQKLLLLQNLILLTSCSAQITYYITPTPDTPCPGKPCRTLSQYVADQYFDNLPVNTTMEFLPGNHTLKQTINFSVTNLTWITLHGDSNSFPEITSRIVCTWPAGFVFIGIAELHISELTFISCGHNDSAAVNIISVQQSNISNCSFHNSMNTGARGYNDDGAALYIENSKVILTGNSFQNNSASYDGGVLQAVDSTLMVTGNTFQNNSAVIWGGVLFVYYCTLTVTDNTFQNNSATDGGVLSVLDSTLTVTDNTFQNNTATDTGGVLHVVRSTFTVTANAFQHNSAEAGGVLSVFDSTLTVTDNTFQNNTAEVGGVLYVEGSTLTVTDNTFQNNTAEAGGVLYVVGSTLTVTDNTFQNNSASYDGGVIYAWKSTLTVTDNAFQNNSAGARGGALHVDDSSIRFTDNNFTDSSAELGGAISIIDNSNVSMYGSNIIANNRAHLSGGGIAVWHSKLQLLNTIFANNRAIYGGGLYADNTECNGNSLFTKNLAFEGGGGIYALRSIFFWTKDTTIIENNSAIDGGGLLLLDGSKLYLQPNIAVHLISNSANRDGGAIKVESNPLTHCIPFTDGHNVGNSDCFFQIQSQIVYDIDDVKRIVIHFNNNSAVAAGSDLYGGNIDNCTLSNVKLPPLYSGISPSGSVFDIITSNGNKPTISSDPLDICMCIDDLTNCISSYHPEPVYPGETLEVPVIVPGQRNGATVYVATVQIIYISNNINVSILQASQNIFSTCTPLKYTVLSRAVNTTQEITLYAEGPCPPTETNTLTVSVYILPCPPGFQLSETQPICICAERLQQFTNTCLIDNATVLRAQDDEFWVGYNESTGLILHPHCPFDYCTSKEVYLAVDDSDKQCNYNRSGILCGTCSENLSLALGSSRCLQCSNSYLTLLAAFAFSGFALVLSLLVLRLTVAAGTINSLIFYANVVAVNSALFLQPQSTNVPKMLIAKVLTLFIAWLNLDLGIETCFYNGMDAYVKTWLQFAFPLYVWILVGTIIIGSYYSGRLAKIFGSNPVAVLATLFLLSYAKLFRTIIAALSYTSLQYPNNSQIAVWLYDGNIKYFSGKHIPLFTVAMVCLVFLVLPYTMLLIFGQWLQTKSALRIFSCINSRYVKPFLDAYHAPYTDKHRYWTGLVLLFRLVLFLISAVNALGDPSVNLLATGSITAAMLTLLTILGAKIYKTWYLCVLETSFIFNLAILTVASYYIRLTSGNQNAVTITSVGIAFTTFIGIVIYHSVQQIKDTRWMGKIFSKLSLSLKSPRHTPEKTSELDYVIEDLADWPVTAPTTTVIDLNELHSYMLREPCMETNQ